MDIIIEVNGKIAKSPREKIVCDNKDYYIEFRFSSEWENQTARTACFKFAGNNIEVPFTGNRVQVPAVQDASKLEVGVYAGDLCTTTPALIGCKLSIRSGGGVHKDPPKDVYDQIMELIRKLQVEKGLPSDALPLMNEAASPGESMAYSRADHVHPTDTSRASAKALDEEIARAKRVEEANASAISKETERATEAERANATAISNEVTRSTVAEQTLRDALAKFEREVNALLSSDTDTLDELQEIVDYIKNNKTLIDAITINKVNVSDVVDHLLSTAINKPLSANQGRVLKELIDTFRNTYNEKVASLDTADEANAKAIDALDKKIADATATANEAKATANTLDATIQATSKHSIETREQLNEEITRSQVEDQALRDALAEFERDVKALLSSDTDTLNELQEIVDYIKNNKTLIDAITINKVNVADVVDHLLSTATDKPLSANQGRVLKALIDEFKTAYENKVREFEASAKANADAIKAEETRAKTAEASLDERVKANNVLAQNAVAVASSTLDTASRAKALSEETAAGLKSHITAYTQKARELDVADQALRDALDEFTARVNALLSSDDTTLDQLQEVVDYIKNNKDLIDGITTSKVNVTDIVDHLLSTAINKPLSANQGRILKDSLTQLAEEIQDGTITVGSAFTDENGTNIADTFEELKEFKQKVLLNRDIALTNGSKGLAYRIYDDYAECVGIGKCTDTEIEIASMVMGLPVMNIAEYAFDNQASSVQLKFTKLYLPEGIGYIAPYGFHACPLEEVTIMGYDGYVFIESNAFADTGTIKTLVLGCREVEVGESAFDHMDIKEIKYVGTEEDWQELVYGASEYNQSFWSAPITFNYVIPPISPYGNVYYYD